MKFLDYLRWIFRALWMQRMRSALTIVGFAIGIAAMVLLSSLGEGLRLFVIQEFTQFGSHIVAVTPGKTETFGLGGILNTTRPLSLEDAEALERIPGVEQVVPVVFGTAQIKALGRSRYTEVAGVGALADKAWKLEVSQGSFLPVEDVHRARAFAVLGSKLKQELFGNTSPLGEFVHIGGNRFRVIGVMEPKGQFLGTDLDDMIYIPANKGLQIFNRESLMEVDIFYSPAVPTDRLTDNVKRLLIERHGFEDFTIVTQDQMMATMDNILRILKYAGGGLGAISLLVGAVGITTILMITVTERTSEVGLLRALGSTRGQVRNLFLGEAVMLGLIGGLAGVLAIALLIVAVQLFVPALPVALKGEIVTVALMASMLIGLIAGVRPALNATRLSPIDALRAE
ncbi:ABC transporter permease [Porticoccus litoralis]|uniref:ABC transporter permease n=1 Tax=Porticoccus litoralis TaxID=434086 RepID=A0AAW8B203_9GAMM|nr:ABC transporter permease [Porticoccus litoralis]MDP1519821.1 ABC transporter permease [Porticoccus litoralis]